MAKEKATANTKKASDSASKGSQSVLSKLIRNLTEKVVAPNKSGSKAKSASVKPVKATEKAVKKVAANPKAGKKATPSTLSSSGSAAAVTPTPEPVAPAKTPVVTEVDDLEVVLTDAEGRAYCRAMDCDQVGMVDGYCRYHYLYFWKKIQVRKKILADGKLERYIEELTSRYTDKFIELLRKDTRSEKDFMAAVQELELDDSASNSQQDDDEAKTYLEEISGVSTESSSRDDDAY